VNEYSDYVAIQVKNREIFCLNYAPDIRTFASLLSELRSSWTRLGTTRDATGRSHAGLLLFSNILIRHAIFGFEHLASYQSFLTWLTFRPGLEALLIIGKFVDDPANAGIWKARQSDFKTYNRTFSGTALESRSLPRSADFRQVLARLNDDFMHPNPYFTYRDTTVTEEGDAAVVEIEFFDKSAEVHEGHLLAYVNLIDLVVSASDALVSSICGSAGTPSPREEYSKREHARATRLAAQNSTAKKVMEELGLWSF